MALPAALVPRIAEALEKARRPSVIWLPFQECTGCTESITRAHGATLESLIFDAISLDYQHTLQAAAGDAAEQAREQAMKDNWGKYLLIVDGSIPTGNRRLRHHRRRQQPRRCCTRPPKGAAAIVALGTCAAFGGIPMAEAEPDRRGAGVATIVKDKPIINVSGLPADPGRDHRRADAVPDVRQDPRTRRARPPEGLLRPDDPRPLLSPPVLRAWRVRRDLRRRGRAQGLVPVQARLQGADDLQRLRHRQVERRHELPDRGRPRLHRLLRTATSGTRAASTSRCPTGNWGTAKTVGTAVGVGVALGVASAALSARKRQKDMREEGMTDMTLLEFARGPALHVGDRHLRRRRAVAPRRRTAAAHEEGPLRAAQHRDVEGAAPDRAALLAAAANSSRARRSARSWATRSTSASWSRCCSLVPHVLFFDDVFEGLLGLDFSDVFGFTLADAADRRRHVAERRFARRARRRADPPAHEPGQAADLELRRLLQLVA